MAHELFLDKEVREHFAAATHRRFLPRNIYRFVYVAVLSLSLLFLVKDLIQLPFNYPTPSYSVTSEKDNNGDTHNSSAQQTPVEPTIPLKDHAYVSVSLLLTSAIFLIVIFLELATYKPKLFMLADATLPSQHFFAQMRKVFMGLHDVLNDIEHTPPKSYSSMKQMEENLLVEANHSCVLETLRMRITLNILGRLICMLLALSLCAYALTQLMRGHFIRGLVPDASFLRHVYYTMVTFFTIGIGDVSPYPNPIGYVFVIICAFLLMSITYFIFSFVISSYFDFQSNVRHAAHNYVVSIAKF